MSIQVQPLKTSGAEVLLWQSRIRIAVALIAGGTELGLQRAGLLTGGELPVLLGLAGYLVVTRGIALLIRRSGQAHDWMVALTVLMDLLFVFVMTVAVSPPAYYGRVLLLSFFIIHLTESYFGRFFAAAALTSVVVGYVGLLVVGVQHGARVAWPQEVLSLAAYALAASAFIVQYDSFRRRLTTIVALFERAEEGDLSETYDVIADSHPDAITQVGRAYNRVRNHLVNMVTTDPLTECLNRRGFDQSLAREVARSTRSGSDLALLALDLDHFKIVNDTFGHMAGDNALHEAGALLLRAVRTGDIVARTGGEEFSIILPDTDGAGAFQLATRVCDMFRQQGFELGGKDVQITVSIGVIAMVPERGRDVAEELKARADDALYAAKRSGRDRARSWTPEMSVRRSGELSAEVLARLLAGERQP